MDEAYLKARLVKAILKQTGLLPEAVRRHEDKFTGGGPDLSVSRRRRTIWAEVKLDRPGRKGKMSALQVIAMRALDGLLITYGLDRSFKRTRVEDANGEVLLDVRGPRFLHDAVAKVVDEQLQGSGARCQQAVY